MKKVVLNIVGMHCSSCSILIDTVLEELRGVKSARTSYADSQVEVVFDPTQVAIPQLISAIKSEGYEVM